MKVPGPYLPSLKPLWWGCWDTFLQPHEGGNPAAHLDFASVDKDSTTVFWCLADVEWLLSPNVSVSLGFPLLVFQVETAGSCGDFFVWSLWHIWVAGFFFKSKVCEAKRKSREVTIMLLPGHWGFWPVYFSSFWLSVFLCLSYIISSGFSYTKLGAQGKVHHIASFWMWTFLKLWKTFSFHLPVINIDHGFNFRYFFFSMISLLLFWRLSVFRL